MQCLRPEPYAARPGGPRKFLKHRDDCPTDARMKRSIALNEMRARWDREDEQEDRQADDDEES